MCVRSTGRPYRNQSHLYLRPLQAFPFPSHPHLAVQVREKPEPSKEEIKGKTLCDSQITNLKYSIEGQAKRTMLFLSALSLAQGTDIDPSSLLSSCCDNHLTKGKALKISDSTGTHPETDSVQGFLYLISCLSAACRPPRFIPSQSHSIHTYLIRI